MNDDFDDFGGSMFGDVTTKLIVFGFFLGILLLFYFVILPGINSPDYKHRELQRELLYNQTMQLLDNKNVTCNQISQLRLISIQHNDDYIQDPFYDGIVINHARDIWNAKGCGSHWGWFEK